MIFHDTFGRRLSIEVLSILLNLALVVVKFIQVELTVAAAGATYLYTGSI